MKKQTPVLPRVSFAFVIPVLLTTFLGGCGEYSFLDPAAVVAVPPTNLTNVIYTVASPADETQELPPGATFPNEDDLKYEARDYVVGALDIVDVSILDLYQEGLETVVRRQVSESGNISLPQLPAPIRAEGLTQEKLRERIVEAYSPDILRNPTVAVTVVLQRQNTFSVLGGAARPGSFNMMKRDTRLLDAIAAAGGQVQTNIGHIYIFRQQPAKPLESTGGPSGNGGTELPDLPAIPDDSAKPRTVTPGTGPATTQPKTDDLKKILPDAMAGIHLAELGAASADAGKTGAATKSAATSQSSEDIFGWNKVGQEGRIIAIDVAKLNSGDARMNIIIRDNDIISIPLLEQGEFYVMGEVQRPGVYSLTGRKVTIKMAIAAAGNFSPMAWPQNVILVRRLNEHQEQMIPLDLDKIFKGSAPDIYLKPNDVLAVGTHWSSTFIIVIRNAFRLTYGFGFIYDRNFGVGVDPNQPLNQKRFTRW